MVVLVGANVQEMQNAKGVRSLSSAGKSTHTQAHSEPTKDVEGGERSEKANQGKCRPCLALLRVVYIMRRNLIIVSEFPSLINPLSHHKRAFNDTNSLAKDIFSQMPHS